MDGLQRTKLVLEVALLAMFLLLLITILNRDGRHVALGLLTNNKPWA